MLSDEEAEAFIADSSFLWHQRFHLGPNVTTPGANDIEWLLQRAGLPDRLDELSVLDIGTSNGGASFIAGACQASRVVSVDLCDEDRFGFGILNRTVGGSKAEFVQSSVYDLPDNLDGTFDVVLFLGVLYHLRHPLLGLDAVRHVTAGRLYLETAIDPDNDGSARASFYPGDELNRDTSNWFSPNLACLAAWVRSAGFAINWVDAWPEGQPERALIIATPVAEPDGTGTDGRRTGFAPLEGS